MMLKIFLVWCKRISSFEAVKIAVEDSKSEYENIMNRIKIFEKHLKDYHTKVSRETADPNL